MRTLFALLVPAAASAQVEEIIHHDRTVFSKRAIRRPDEQLARSAMRWGRNCRTWSWRAYKTREWLAAECAVRTGAKLTGRVNSGSPGLLVARPLMRNPGHKSVRQRTSAPSSPNWRSELPIEWPVADCGHLRAAPGSILRRAAGLSRASRELLANQQSGRAQSALGSSEVCLCSC